MKRKLLVVLAAVASTLLATALIVVNGTAHAGNTVEKSLSISLPDSRALFLTVDVNDEPREVINRPGAKDAFLTITVSGTQVTDVFLAPSAKCEGTAVDQRAQVTLGGDSAQVTITRTFKPIDPETGEVGPEQTETHLDLKLGPGPKNKVGADFCA